MLDMQNVSLLLTETSLTKILLFKVTCGHANGSTGIENKEFSLQIVVQLAQRKTELVSYEFFLVNVFYLQLKWIMF